MQKECQSWVPAQLLTPATNPFPPLDMQREFNLGILRNG